MANAVSTSENPHVAHFAREGARIQRKIDERTKTRDRQSAGDYRDSLDREISRLKIDLARNNTRLETARKGAKGHNTQTGTRPAYV